MVLIRRFLRRRFILPVVIIGVVLFVYGLPSLRTSAEKNDDDAANDVLEEEGTERSLLKRKSIVRIRNETKTAGVPKSPFKLAGHETIRYYARPSHEEGKPRNPVPVILYWSTFFGGNDFGYLKGTEYSQNHCGKIIKCEVTSDRNRFTESSALLIHGSDPYPQIPTTRKPWQRVIFYYHEPPYHKKFPSNLFNLTMTYRMDADIFMPYGYFMKFDKPQMGPVINYASGKTDLILWIVSNCHASSKRMNYVRHLQKHANVAIHGACGKGRCDDGFGPNSCHAISKAYKFYLSFENTISQDYITEKIFVRMQSGLVPIVMGGANYEGILPPHSYINIADFKSPKELAAYLKLLDSDDKLYNAYFEWKTKYMPSITRAPAFCKLCALLHSTSESYQSYEDVLRWWHNGKNVGPEVMYPHLAEFFK